MAACVSVSRSTASSSSSSPRTEERKLQQEVSIPQRDERGALSPVAWRDLLQDLHGNADVAVKALVMFRSASAEHISTCQGVCGDTDEAKGTIFGSGRRARCGGASLLGVLVERYKSVYACCFCFGCQRTCGDPDRRRVQHARVCGPFALCRLTSGTCRRCDRSLSLDTTSAVGDFVLRL